MAVGRRILLAVATVGALALNLSPPMHALATTSDIVDGASGGKRLDGLASIRRGGGRSGLTIDYLGGQNESGYDKAWLESLKSALQQSSFPATKVIGGDEVGDVWNVVNDMANDPTFFNSMDVAGLHYPCRNVGSPATDCT